MEWRSEQRLSGQQVVWTQEGYEGESRGLKGFGASMSPTVRQSKVLCEVQFGGWHSPLMAFGRAFLSQRSRSHFSGLGESFARRRSAGRGIT